MISLPMPGVPISIIVLAIRLVEIVPLPDAFLRMAIRLFIKARKRIPYSDWEVDSLFAKSLGSDAIALHPEAANEQHYALPEEFFGLTLGPQRKYSCCYYPKGHETLCEAEKIALSITAERARLEDGQKILELGCGWGSFTLFMAKQFPNSSITAVSNSVEQRKYIEKAAKMRELKNLKVLTEDMNTFAPQGSFDRIVSIEMFEHMSNWRALLARLKKHLAPQGRLFLHIFTHKTTPYRFDHNDPTDWIGQYFFTGGIMPNETLLRQFEDLFIIEDEWRWSGTHYEKTANQWLKNFDQNKKQIFSVLQKVYGNNAKIWMKRWRLFYLATAGIFGAANGEEWGVKHYLLKASP